MISKSLVPPAIQFTNYIGSQSNDVDHCSKYPEYVSVE